MSVTVNRWISALPAGLRLIQVMAWGSLVLYLLVNLSISAFYQGRFYPGVSVAGIKLEGKTREEARQLLAAQPANYQLSIEVAGTPYQVMTDDLGVSYDLEATVEAAWAVGRDAGLEATIGGPSQDLAYAYEVDRSKLAELVKKMSNVTGISPTDATVVINGSEPRVQPEQPGRTLNPQYLTRILEDAIRRRQTRLAVGLQPVAPEIVSSDATRTAERAKQIIASRVELKYQGKAFVPDAATIAGWLTFVKEGQPIALVPKLDEARVKNYVNGLANQIDIAPKNKKVNILNGVVSNTEEGANGLAVDQNNVTNSIIGALTGTGNLQLEIPTRPVAFKTQYNHSISLDYGRYIEVNLSSQRLWAYQDHQVVYSSPITSGAAGAGLATATGLFSIYSKTTNTRLIGYQYGYNYNVPVAFWMPFYKGYGLHDASWRSSFGGPDYYYGGSHGCVNLPYATAAWIYGWADIGTPVWVHT